MGTAGCEVDGGDGETPGRSNSVERRCSRLSLSKKDELFMVRKSAEEFCGPFESRG